MANRGPVIAITLTADDKTERGFKTAKAEVEGFGSKVSGMVVGVGAAIGTMAADLISTGVGAARDFVNGAVQQASDLSESQNAVNTIFGDSAREIAAWADKNANAFGLTRAEFNQMATPLGAMLKNAGLGMDTVTGSTIDLTERAADMASVFNAEVPEALAAIQAGIRGESDPLERFGVKLSAAAVEQQALAETGKDTVAELTEEEKALARISLILEQTASVAGDFTRTSGEYANAQRISRARTAELQAEIGQKLMPVMQKITEWKLKLTQVVADKLLPAFEKFAGWIQAEVVPAVQAMIATFAEKWPEIQAKIEPVLIWLEDTLNDVVTVLTGLWNTFGQSLVEFTEKAWGPISKIVEGAMQVIKGVIDVVLGILTGDWDKAWRGIKSIVEGIWNQITGLIGLALDAIELLINLALDAIGSLLEKAWDGIKRKAGDMWDAITGTISGAWESIKDGISGAAEWVGSKVDEIAGFVTGLPGRMVGVFDGMFDGIKEAFRSAVNWIIDAWNGLDFEIPGFDPPGPGPKFGGFTLGLPDIPRLEHGGIVRHRPGGILANLGEGRWDEAVIPLDGGELPGDTTTIHQYFPAGTSADDVARAQLARKRRTGSVTV